MTIQLLTGDARDVLPTLASNSVHCVVTSPPYYGLRDYGTALWDGGDAGCDHANAFHSNDPVPPACRRCSTCKTFCVTVWMSANAVRATCEKCGEVTIYRDVETRGTWITDTVALWKGGHVGERGTARDRLADICPCGARRIDRQLGLEATPDAYIATMVAVFREVRRVLRPDGTCWVNMGDSYAGNGLSGGDGTAAFGGTRPDKIARQTAVIAEQGRVKPGKPKDLLMMPARLALALQADGWWLRSAIVWAKPNPMPESVSDRPTNSYEMVYLLTRSARYFYDADAVREPHTEGTHSRGGDKTNGRDALIKSGHWNTLPPTEHPAGRNLRNVWNIATHPYIHAHFATYPPALVERCIRAGTSERGCCAACGAPWVRVTERERHPGSSPERNDNGSLRSSGNGDRNDAEDTRWHTVSTTTGWRASCTCSADVVPATILDPFLGSGTTALVADRLQRHCIGIDLSTTYADLARNRIEADAPLFTSWAPAEPPEDERMRDLFAEAAE